MTSRRSPISSMPATSLLVVAKVTPRISVTWELAQAIDEACGQIEKTAPAGRARLRAPAGSRPRATPGLADAGVATVAGAIDAPRAGVEDGDREDLRGPEWRVLRDPEQAPQTDDFNLRPGGAPVDYAGALGDVVLVERLREVSALTGFTRISAPDERAASGAAAPTARARSAAS